MAEGSRDTPWTAIALALFTFVQACVLGAMQQGWHPWERTETIAQGPALGNGRPATKADAKATNASPAAISEKATATTTSIVDPSKTISPEPDRADILASDNAALEQRVKELEDAASNIGMSMARQTIKVDVLLDKDVCKDKMKKTLLAAGYHSGGESSNVVFVKDDEGSSGWAWCAVDDKRVYYGAVSTEKGAAVTLRSQIGDAIIPSLIP